MCISSLEWEYILERYTPEIFAAAPGVYDTVQGKLEAGWSALDENRRGVIADEAEAAIFPDLHRRELEYRIATGLQGAELALAAHLVQHPEVIPVYDPDEDDEDDDDDEDFDQFEVIADLDIFA